MDEGTKPRLAELHALSKLESGKTVTQQALLLRRIIDRADESKSAIIDSFRDKWEGFSEAEIDRWLSGTPSSGVEMTEGEIDAGLYRLEIE